MASIRAPPQTRYSIDLCDHVDIPHIVSLFLSLSLAMYTRIRYIAVKSTPCLGARKNSISTLNFTKLALARVKDVQRSKRRFSAITTLPGRSLVSKTCTYLQEFHQSIDQVSVNFSIRITDLVKPNSFFLSLPVCTNVSMLSARLVFNVWSSSIIASFAVY